MARDETLLKDLKYLRGKKAKAEAEKKFSIVCDHVIFAPEPFKTTFIKRNPVTIKDTGKTFLCTGCALVFETQVLEANPAGFQAVEDRLFRKNVLNYQ